MTQYRNSGSGISAYEIEDDRIRIRFNSGTTYTYRASRIGQNHYNRMVELALRGAGLNTYINQNPSVKMGFG